MRIELVTEKRLGMIKDVLQIFFERGWMIRGVEVAWHHIYLDIPRLSASNLDEITEELKSVHGLRSIHEIDLLPGERRRMHFDVLLGALNDPIIAVDANMAVVAANDASVTHFGISHDLLDGSHGIAEILGADVDIQISELVNFGGGGEVNVHSKPFLVDVFPLSGSVEDVPEVPHGAVLAFRSPASLGQDIHAISKRETGREIRLVGQSPAMQKIDILIRRFGSLDAPLLILGETGTGKELVARACHRASSRSNKSFLALNCAALPESLAESELFGYAPGAFSGAQKSGKPGLFELADGGTVFLDEIGEMSPYLQAKLLRFLQDGTFMRIGAKSETQVNIRLISATHRDLQSMVKDGSFREDLYYRLHVLTIKLPPLRERRDDVSLLAKHFLERAMGQIGVSLQGITPQALALLERNEWPGNARQLENTIFRAVSLCDGNQLDVGDLEEFLDVSVEASPRDRLQPTVVVDLDETHGQAMDRMEKEMLQTLYDAYPSTRKLAQRLGLSHTSVANKLRRYGIG